MKMMMHDARKKEELKKKNRQAIQEWLWETVRFVSKTIKWLTPSKDDMARKMNVATAYI